MQITVTELRNHLSHYLDLSINEDVHVTRRGKVISRLIGPVKEKVNTLNQLEGIIADNFDESHIKDERLAECTGGRPNTTRLINSEILRNVLLEEHERMLRNREVYKKKAALKNGKHKGLILASIMNLEEQIEDLERILELDGDSKKFTID